LSAAVTLTVLVLAADRVAWAAVQIDLSALDVAMAQRLENPMADALTSIGKRSST
jgi:hypothetical protein